ncbi:TrbI/VirB10 family protein [Brevundimonas diminuta]|uniref:TrbI/VirB10 family protein n=1 Tax=Brevundimonas diminuta TaxID=293 RepID=UPI001905658B|nr:TrbI/VirB10 family protein [Brevundimonas diminuta]MBK1970880.1 TrbI/VirB10 family protein [Brevundimonas diminuta]
MSETAPGDDAAIKAMRLRAEPPRPLRLSRKVAMAGVAGLALAVAAAVGLGLLKPEPDAPTVELTRSSAPPPDAVRALPGDYTAPRLGPPLPGDLGRPILNARNAAEAEAAPVGSPAGPDSQSREADARQAERERRRAEADAARTSTLLLIQGGAPLSEGVAVPTGPLTGGHAAAAPSATSGATLLAGAVIEASLVTGIRSDLPGPVLGQITADVHDTRTGRTLLVPKGSRLIGTHTAQVAQGQSRLQVVWTRLILPSGRSILLEDQMASDPQGYAGLEDRTDQRWGERLRSAALTTLLAVSSAAVEVDEADRLARAIRDGTSDGVDALGRGLVERGLSIPPRLTIRPGFAFRIILTHDLDLQPYGE